MDHGLLLQVVAGTNCFQKDEPTSLKTLNPEPQSIRKRVRLHGDPAALMQLVILPAALQVSILGLAWRARMSDFRVLQGFLCAGLRVEGQVLGFRSYGPCYDYIHRSRKRAKGKLNRECCHSPMRVEATSVHLKP